MVYDMYPKFLPDGSDYVSAAQTFHFNNNNTDEVQAFNLTLMDDSFLEGNEEFSVAMRFDSLNVATTISTIEVTIVDNDGEQAIT